MSCHEVLEACLIPCFDFFSTLLLALALGSVAHHATPSAILSIPRHTDTVDSIFSFLGFLSGGFSPYGAPRLINSFGSESARRPAKQ